MSVRHVHARPGEYIAVHRNHRYHSSGSGGDDDGCLMVLLFIVGFILLVNFWPQILCIAIGWLIWKYHTPIWKVISWIGLNLWKFLSGGCKLIQTKVPQRKVSRQNISVPKLNMPSDYGKIRQHRQINTNQSKF